ncbi:MAG: hypothetical protein ABS910_08285 [Arthrobacter sp.]
MGRHRAEPEVRRRGHRAEKRAGHPQRSTELLGWGIFIAATTAGCLLWAELPLSVSAGTPALLLAAFTAAWYGSRTSALPQQRTEPAAAREDSIEKAANDGGTAPTADTPVHDGHPVVTVPAIPLAPGAAREFLNTPAPGQAGQASRWTRTFGPPDTGSLPLQPYIPAAHPPVKTADSEHHDRRQRSHSSL